MKRKIVLSVVIMLMLMFLTTTGHAQVRAGSFTISPTVGGYMFEGNEDMSNSLAVGLRAGYNFTKYFGIEGFGYWVPTERRSRYIGDTDLHVVGYGVEAIFNILPDRALVPFLAVGGGGIHYSSAHQRSTENNKDKFIADYGAGVKYFLTENIALRADVRHVIPFDDVHNNLLYTVGVSFAFGGAKKPVVTEGAAVRQAAAPAEVVIDSDKDGVPDNKDKCPDTPLGVKVDRNGCPLDSDSDGVPDYLDKCPGDPVNIKVDKDGCPVDSDKDGVPDYLDKCPDTPVGVKVDIEGCPPPPPAPVQEMKREAQMEKEIVEKGRTTLMVLFDFDKAVVKKECYDEIDHFAAVMKKHTELDAIIIEGHTDSVGSNAYNKRLSQKRAEAVKKYLVEKGGIEAKRLKAIGYGEENPIASNATKEGRDKNRRVEAAVDYKIEKAKKAKKTKKK